MLTLWGLMLILQVINIEKWVLQTCKLKHSLMLYWSNETGHLIERQSMLINVNQC